VAVRISSDGNKDTMTDQHGRSTFRHGARQLTGVTVETYNAELRDSEGFIGDRASKRAFVALLESWRERLRQVGDDQRWAIDARLGGEDRRK
jgi:hypothetical protein